MATFRSIRLATFGAAFGAALLVGTASAVPAQPPAGAGAAGQGEIRRGERRAEQGARRRFAQRGEQVGRALFRDITLTDAQKTQVRDIQKKYADQRRTTARDLREKAGAGSGQRPDSAARAQLRARLQTEGRAQMDRQFAELRNVLTADQRTTFDRNVTTMRERLSARPERAKDARPGRRAPRRDA